MNRKVRHLKTHSLALNNDVPEEGLEWIRTPLAERNRNTTLSLGPATTGLLSSKGRRRGQDENNPVQFFSCQSQPRPSHIQQLKQEVEYLQQDHELQFPGPTHPDGVFSKSCSQQIVHGSSQGFVLMPSQPRQRQQKLRRKYLRERDRRRADPPEEFAAKTLSKFQLIAPYRKYFQSQRFPQPRSCTLRLDDVMGRHITHITRQDRFGNRTLDSH